MRRAPLFPAVLAALLLPSAAYSQVCSGFPFTRASLQVTADGSMSDNGTAFGGGLGLGSGDVFGRLGVGLVRTDGLDGLAVAVSAELGFPLHVVDPPVDICPTVSIGMANGSTLDYNGDGTLVLDVSEESVAAGLSVGAVVVRGGSTAIIPIASIGLGLVHARADTPEAPDFALDDTQTFGLASLGVSVVLSTALTVHVGGAAPIGLDDGKAVFRIATAYNFGRRRQPS